MEIREEHPDDAAGISALTTDAFRNASHASGTEAAIVEALRAAGALTLSLVATDKGALVGHVAVSRVTISSAEGKWFGLGPVSVAPARQRQGIGSALIREALDRLSAMGAEGCIVLGDPRYYSRFGFANDPALHYADIPPPYLQRIVLKGSTPKGKVAYHPAFAAS